MITLVVLALLGLGVLAAIAASAYIGWSLDPAWILSAGIVATVFSGHWTTMGVPVPLDRALLLAGVISLAVRWFTQLERPPLRLHPAFWLLATAGAFAVASAMAAGEFANDEARFGLLDRFGFVPWLMFAVAPLAFATERQRRILLGAFVGLGAYLGITTMLSVVGIDQLVFPQYINDPAIGIHAGRARGPFVQGTENGLALSACAVAALIGVGLWRSREAKLASATIAALCGVSALLVLQRSIWLGFFGAVLVTGLLFRDVRRPAVTTAVVAALLLVPLFVLVPGLSQTANERRTDQGSIWDRENTNGAGFRMLEAKPLLGFGWNQFRTENDPYFRQGAVRPLTGTEIVLHNVFLSNAVELGLIGATLWFAGLAFAFVSTALTRGPPEHRLWKLGFVAITVQWFIVANLSPLTGPFVYLVLWTWAGVVWAASRGEMELAPAPRSLTAPRRLLPT